MLKLEDRKQKLLRSGKAYNIIKIPEGNHFIIETPISKLLDEFREKLQESDEVFAYTTECYLECVFSFIDHLCSLLYPMTSSFHKDIPYLIITTK